MIPNQEQQTLAKAVAPAFGLSAEEMLRRLAANPATAVAPELKLKLKTIVETAEILGVCAGSVRNRIKDGTLSTKRVGHRVLVPLSVIENFINQQGA